MLISWLVQSGEIPNTASSKPRLAVSIQPRHLTDALRAVILSDREVYMDALTRHPADPGVRAPGSALEADLPNPCEFLRLGSQATASKGVEYSYVLRAFQPINKRNSPETETERKGLQFVGTRPDLTYTSEELLGGRWYFTAVYPDVARDQRCLDCHNRLNSAREQKWNLGEVLGALIVRVALEL